MDQLTFCPFVTHLLSCRFDFFVTLFGFIGAVSTASFSFIVCLRPLRLLRWVLCVKMWIILSCNSRGLIDLVAKYLNHHASPGKRRSALNHLYMLWSIFLKKTVIPVKPFGCKRLWPTHCWALHQKVHFFYLPVLCQSYCSPSKQIITRPTYACSWRYFSLKIYYKLIN